MNFFFSRPDYWILFLVLGFAILIPLIILTGVLWKFFLAWRTPTTWISSLPTQGRVEVQGKIRGDPMKSPFRKVECGYWQLEVQEYQNQGRGGGRWRTMHRASSGSFMLDDMTGRIQVGEGKPSLVSSNEYSSDNSDTETVSFIESLGIKTKGFLGFSKRLRLYERLIMQDEDILVLGKLQKSNTPVTITGNDLVPLVISNLGRAETNKALLIQSVKPALIPLVIGAGIVVFSVFSSQQ